MVEAIDVWEARDIWEICVLYAQFYCEPKTSLKKVSL